MTSKPSTDIAALEVLVRKSGVALGGLPPSQRQLALAAVCSCIAEGRIYTEPEVNEALKTALANEASFLDVDHVELRRWLVDTGLWTRDGYGRAYRRAPCAALVPGLRRVAEALADVDVRAWVAVRREALQTQREARRRAWQSRSREQVSRG